MNTGKPVVIVGGGIAGLSTAYELAKANVPYTIVEQRPRLGGVIQTSTRDGCVIEAGPDSFISQKPEALALIKELGMESEVIGSNDHSRLTYILRHGKLVRLPEGVMLIVPSKVWPMVKSPLLGIGTKLRMGLELLRKPPRAPLPDRSVAEFVVDHFGQETLDYLAEPLLSGVYGGDPRNLSIVSVLPRFAEMETKTGSLGRAVMNARSKAPPSSGTLFRTLKGGLETLTGRLAQGACVTRGEAQAVERVDDWFRVRVAGNWIDAAAVVLACPAWAASSLTTTIDARVSELLGGIPYTSSATVALSYKRAEFDGRSAGHGFLIPKKERRRMAACTFVNEKFDHRAPPDKMLLRCFFGGAGDAAVLDETDEALVAMAREELRTVLGLNAKPEFTSVSRWARSMAQYTVGHAKRWAEIKSRVEGIDGLYLAGNGYTGIGIPDCIRMGREAGKNISRKDR
ncbi:MAG TPA: protoporphyrinogen oxidase [Bryobacteraceae bacterium]